MLYYRIMKGESLFVVIAVLAFTFIGMLEITQKVLWEVPILFLILIKLLADDDNHMQVDL